MVLIMQVKLVDDIKFFGTPLEPERCMNDSLYAFIMHSSVL
jgi:hypothetical protein